MKKIFIICSVRNTSDEYKQKLEKYVDILEENGNKVHLPHRDTNQNASGFKICLTNTEAIKNSDEVHIFYNSMSQGTHFDLGTAFSFNKKIVIVENEEFDEGKSFARMLTEWSNEQELNEIYKFKKPNYVVLNNGNVELVTTYNLSDLLYIGIQRLANDNEIYEYKKQIK